MQTLAKVREMLGTGAIGKSEIRDTRKETYQKAEYIPGIKRTKGKRSRLFIVQDLELPFDPFTGEEDDIYNDVHRFRPALSVDTVVALIKNEWKKDPELKQRCLDLMGKKEYNLDPNVEYTAADVETDYEIFGDFLRHRTFSLNVITINCEPVTHNKYPQKYLFEDEINEETGEYDDPKVILLVSRFYNSLHYRKKTALNEEWEKAKKGQEFDLSRFRFSDAALPDPSKLGSLTEKEMNNLYNEFRSENLVSGPGPFNQTLVIEFELPATSSTFTSSTIDEISKSTAVSLKKHWHVTNNTAEFKKNVLEDDDYKKQLAKEMNYIEVTMKCPDDTDVPMLIGKETRYLTVDSAERLYTKPEVNKAFKEALSDLFIETAETIDDTYKKRSSRVKPYTDALDSAILSHFSTSVDLLKNPWADPELLAANSDLISMLYPDSADEVALADVDEGEMKKVETASKSEGSYDFADADYDEVAKEDGEAEKPSEGSVETEELELT